MNPCLRIFIVKSKMLNLADSRIICLGAGPKYITKSQVRHSTVIITDVNTQEKCVTDTSQLQMG